VNANEEFISMKMPQNSEFAGYFAIEYENGSFRIYKRQILRGPGPERIDIYYNVFIENNELKIIRTNSSFEDINVRHDEFYWGTGLFFESKDAMTEWDISIVFKNNTKEKLGFLFYEPFSDFINVSLNVKEEFYYRIKSDIFTMHGIVWADLGWDNKIYLFPNNLYRYDPVDGKRALLSQIEIIINENGYTKTNIYQHF
jgi:hypothetical protein